MDGKEVSRIKRMGRMIRINVPAIAKRNKRLTTKSPRREGKQAAEDTEAAGTQRKRNPAKRGSKKAKVRKTEKE